MNQNDYKEISGIIKRNYPDVYDYEASLAIDKLTLISRELADYFEREEKEDIEKSINLSKTFHSGKKVNLKPIFNRKQFLKDCGAEKWTKTTIRKFLG